MEPVTFDVQRDATDLGPEPAGTTQPTSHWIVRNTKSGPVERNRSLENIARPHAGLSYMLERRTAPCSGNAEYGKH